MLSVYLSSLTLLSRRRSLQGRATDIRVVRGDEGSPLSICLQPDGLVCFCLTDPLCSKFDQEREAWRPSQQKLKGELARGDGSS